MKGLQEVQVTVTVGHGGSSQMSAGAGLGPLYPTVSGSFRGSLGSRAQSLLNMILSASLNAWWGFASLRWTREDEAARAASFRVSYWGNADWICVSTCCTLQQPFTGEMSCRLSACCFPYQSYIKCNFSLKFSSAIHNKTFLEEVGRISLSALDLAIAARNCQFLTVL